MANVSDNVWFEYAKGIQTWAGKDGGNTANVDTNAMYFIASAVNKGPAAGSFVPDTMMNWNLYQICDALISDSSPIYNPGTKGSYFDNLYKYLRAVKLKPREHNEGLQTEYNDAKAALKTASGAYTTAEGDAFTSWEADRRDGKPAGFDFETWVTNGNAPELQAAEQERSNRAQDVNQIAIQLFDADGSTLTDQQNACLAAKNRSRYQIGLNMKCSSDQIPPKEYEKLYREVVDTAQPTTTTTTTTVPALKNPDYFCMPAYSIDSTFKVTMDEWARATNDAKDDVTWTIKSDSIKQSDWKKVGHEEGSGGVSIGWLRIGGSAGKDWSDSKVTNESGSFEIQLSAKRAGLFNVTPGTWNVKNFRQTYRNTEGTVDFVGNAVQPTQLFCVSHVKLRVKFTGNMETAFDKAVNEVKGGGGGISVLGFTVHGAGDKTENETTHTSDLEKKDGWYEISPTLVYGGCSMLAVIGTKFDPPVPKPVQP